MVLTDAYRAPRFMPMENHEVQKWVIRDVVRDLPTDSDSGATWLPLVAEELFAAHVRTEREKRGWTQAKLSRQLTLRGVTIGQSGIAKLERADNDTRRPIRLVEAAAIADLFEMTLDQMISTLVPDSDEHRRFIEARERQERALVAVQAARRELAEAEAAADSARAQVALAVAMMGTAKAAGGDYGEHHEA